MTDIPEDIRKAAAEAHAAFARSSDKRNLGEIIAAAILAERTRIADELFQRSGFMTASSDFTGDYVRIWFPSMKDMHAFHGALVRLSQFKSAHPSAPTETEKAAS